MTDIDISENATVFEAPGPGSWMLDTTHHGRRPTTVFMADLAIDGFSEGFARFTKRFGLPLETMRADVVHGYMYVRPTPVGEGTKPRPAPPAAMMWLVCRLHPELRRRAKTARQAWATELWRADVDSWFAETRDALITTNRGFQDVDPSALSDGELANHIEELVAHISEQFVLAFETHGGDIVPVGDLIATCGSWQITTEAVAPLLSGASPLSTETRDLLAPVAAAMTSVTVAPTSVAEVRALSSEVDAAITKWLDLHGWRLLNSDDVDCPTLHEQPGLQLRILCNLNPDGSTEAAVDAAPVRERVPVAERDRFDRLLADARYGLRQRDDSAGIRLNWPVGLARRALREAGARLAKTRRLAAADHIMCLTPVEITTLLRDSDGPSSADVSQRATTREAQLALDPPLSLGPDEEPPPFAVLPKGMGRVTAAVMAMIESMEAAPTTAPLTGVGVGDTSYTGRACVIQGPDDDFDRIEPGDVLIAPFTSPSFNSVLPLVGAIAVQEGGVLSHTAIVAREFGIPAVVGVAGLLTDIRDGETVQVDAGSGVVRRVSTCPESPRGESNS